MTTGWALEVERGDPSRTTLLDAAVPEPAAGQAVLRTARVGVTANNATYAALGDSLRYWEFFPAVDPARGRVPLWGFAEVVASRAEGVAEGQRVYGYLPPASHLLVTPERADERGFRDASPHRAGLPAAYNSYATTAADPAHRPDPEDLQVLYRPLFLTSFLLADLLDEVPGGGGAAVVLSSASSKTAYGTAFLLRRAGRRTLGLTSAGNSAFTSSLGLYDEVLPYDDAGRLPREPTAYVDVAGSTPLRQRLHAHLGDHLVLDLVVGFTHRDPAPPGPLDGAAPTVFFAPDRMAQRVRDWGRAGLDERSGAAWAAFVPAARGWVDVVAGEGPEALRAAWLEVLSGRSAPRAGHVVTF